MGQYENKEILCNEKYVGFAFAEGTCGRPLNKEMHTNNGELPRYYVKDNHEAIIGRDLFDRCRKRSRGGRNNIAQSQKQLPPILIRAKYNAAAAARTFTGR